MSESSLSSLQLKSIKKYTDDGKVSPRVKSPDDTLAQIIPICKNIGVTRISDITYMDKLYIPNYSIFLPGTEDSIWVYSGKGPTKIQARVSGLMESIERFSSLSSTYSKKFIRGTYLEMSKSYNKVLHPDEVVEPTLPTYSDKYSNIDFIPGFDLQNNQEVLVPAQLVLSKYSTKPPSEHAFLYSHTNGLASGSVMEEAICHALCEVIERDAVSIADLCASSIPYTFFKKIYSLNQTGAIRYPQVTDDQFVDDSSIFQDVDISEISKQYEPIKFLVKRFRDANVSLLIKDITQKDIGIPTFVASSIEWITSDYGYFAKGYGTHVDARIALIRAITELSQTRAGNIQGARDDLKKIQYKQNDEIYKRKWQFMTTSSRTNKNNNKSLLFSEIKTYLKEDILDDIKLILKKLKKAGLRRAIIVDLTNPDIGIPVVRAIVPGLETFEIAKLFTNTELFMGKRAKSYYKSIQKSIK
jgi:ribosomal protein S12 methylthiotransferase accessory factor YcaO